MITPDKVRVYVSCARKDGKREKLRLWYNGSDLIPEDGDIWVVPTSDHIYRVTRITADEFTHIVTDVKIVDSDGIKRWDMGLPKYRRDWLPGYVGKPALLPKSINLRDFLTANARQRAHNFILRHPEIYTKPVDQYTDDELREVLTRIKEIHN